MLCHHHRLRHGETQFAGCLLLERRRGEGWCWHTLKGFLHDVGDLELCVDTFLKECKCLFVRLETMVQFSLHLRLVVIGQQESGADAVIGLALESLNLALALHDESHGHALHTSGGECGLHLTPEHRRQTESHDTVKHTAGLLCIHQVHVEMARVLNSTEDGGFGYLMENDTVGVCLVETQHLAQVPRDGFSFTVFIGS